MTLKILAWGWMPLIASGLLCGQEQQQQGGDPPARVARLNYINTNLSFRPGSQEDWAAATLNYPLTTGDHLWSDQQGGAEMHIGSTALRIAGGTSFAVLNLDDRAVQVSVSQGFMSARVRRLEQGETVEVDTPNGAVSLLGEGDYRIDVNGDTNVTTVTVRAGGAEFNGGGQTFPVNAGQEVRFTGADQLKAEPSQVRPPDQWDQWCISRDEKDDAAQENVSRYVGRNMTGAEDLAAVGEWRSDPTNGAYWVPPVAAGWEPYRAGHWAFVDPWGWTWIDDDPWGFAPFHYGRWALVGGVWGWFPGAAVVVPVYAPALVAFVGGPQFVATVGIDAVAWVPLAPGEVFEPYYHVSDVYVRNVNITSVNASRIHAGNGNGNYANGSHVTAMRKDSFEGAHRVSSGMVRVPSGASSHMQKASASSYHPAREAYMGRRMDGMKAVTPPKAAVSRPVVVNHAPPAMAGRPAAASYRQAPPVTRRMQMGSQGHYQTAANNGNASHASRPTNPGLQPNNGNRGNAGLSAPPGNRGSGVAQQQHPNLQQQQRPVAAQQQHPVAQQQRPMAQQQQRPMAQQQQRPMTQQQQQRPVAQQQQQRPMAQQQQRPVVQQQQQRPNVQQQQQRPVVQQQQQRPNVQQQRPAVPQQRPNVPVKQPPHR